MMPSRNQAQQGPYGPLLTAGLYPLPSFAATANPTATPQPAATPAATPAAPATQEAPAQLYTGSTPQGDGGSASTNDPPGEVSPDQTFSGMLGALGSAASIGLGGPLGGLGMLGALGINSALGVPSFSMQTALDDLAQTAFGRTADVTAGVTGAPEGTGAAVSSWGLAAGPEGGKGGDAMGGTKGEEGGKPGASTDMGPPGGEAKGTDNNTPGGTGEAGTGGHNGGDASQGGTAGSPSSDGAGGMGWMMGGYTGHGDDGVVQREQPAGTVHEGEVVIPAPMVRHYGLPFLMGLVNGNVPKNRLAELARGMD